MPTRAFQLLRIAVLCFFLVVFAWAILNLIDPDLGWHLRAGEIVAVTGHAPQYDPWTYTAPGHEWIDHEWLTDFFLWKFFIANNWRIVQSFFLFCAFIPLAVWILRSRTELQLFLSTIAGTLLLPIVGVRPQFITFFFFFLLYELLFAALPQKIKKWLLLLTPIFFALWANLHAGFVLGLLLWGLTLVPPWYEILRKKFMLSRDILHESCFFVISIVATLATPYGINLWHEIIVASFNPLNNKIIEWQPAFAYWSNTPSFTALLLPLFVGTTIGVLFIFRKEFSLKKLLPAAIFFIFFMQHARMVSFFLILALPLTEEATVKFSEKLAPLVEKIPWWKKKLLFFIPIALLVGALYSTATSSSLTSPYTPTFTAIDVLSGVTDECRTFNNYAYGGWMIFAYPDKQIFIDGRGPHWEYPKGHSTLQEYLTLMDHPETWESVFQKYNICTAIIPAEPKDVSPASPSIYLRQTLKRAGWCQYYADHNAMILRAPNTDFCKNQLRN